MIDAPADPSEDGRRAIPLVRCVCRSGIRQSYVPIQAGVSSAEVRADAERRIAAGEIVSAADDISK
jgi:hypothetical protein